MGSFQTCSTPAPSLQFQDLTDPQTICEPPVETPGLAISEGLLI